MIFPALHRFAQSRGLLDDLDFTEQTIHAHFDLQPDGTLIGVFPVGEKGNLVKKPVSRIASRNSAAIAYLGADNANRVIPGLDPEAKRLTIETQLLFLEQLRTAAAETDHAGITAVTRFLDNLASDEAARISVKAAFDAQKLKVSDWITFRVEGYDGYLIEWTVLKDWWRRKCAAKRESAAASSTDPLVPCMVTGRLCTPVRTHGTRIKVAPGGLPGGVALVSSDKPAFGSYGFEKSLVSPMSEEAVEGYIRATNYLGDKTHPDHHYRTTDTIYLFWCDQPDFTANPAKAVEEGTGPETAEGSDWLSLEVANTTAAAPLSDSPQAAVKVFGSPQVGAIPAGTDAMKARFYCLALSGSSARGIIRGWIDEPLPKAIENVRTWFEDLLIPLDRAIFDPADKTKDLKKRRRLAEPGDRHSRWPLWQLVAALEGKGDSTPELARQRTLLFSCALLGRCYPVPLELIATACRRISTSGDCSPPRAALIQMLLRRHFFQQTELKLTTMSSIDDHIQNSRAFRSGRLLRVLHGIQAKALGDRNASVIDKFYSSASATPAAVLGGLVAKAQPHLSKIRKEHPGLAVWYDEQLTDIVSGIVEQGGFKDTHDPAEQGEFALGFYYQRILARKEKPEADEDLAANVAE
ncbi:CRISPR-associated protein (Cas_Csd1) [mine drainage metagenome]|uniref:CRISPR-associated protein (Cas_Csd1) n=1 Tax=mine drainage metagenome TaxID=410659 RepID=A0A1J5TCF7_9ZZZZ